MNSAIYDLPIKNRTMRWAVVAWLTLGLASLVAAGGYSILLVLARTPVVQEMIPLVDFFRVALVVHVDLSVLIWLLSIAGMMWSLSSARDLPLWDKVSFWLAAGGAVGYLIVSIFVAFFGSG
jgi:hypothetical protein